MNRLLAVLAFLVLLQAGALPVAAAPSAAKASGSTNGSAAKSVDGAEAFDADAILRDLKAKADTVHAIHSAFIQEKKLAIFNQTLVANGVFAFMRPGRLRWEYTQPVRSGFAINDGQGRRWSELGSEDKFFDIRSNPVMQAVSSQVLMWTTLDLDALGKLFTIDVESAAPVVLRFLPRKISPDGIGALRITFTPDGSAIAVIEIQEKEGDTTRIRFVDQRINTDLPPTLFTQP